jgi:hypothetical protein
MVPIHDTDLAQERWSQTEWRHYELWEQVEVKLRHRKMMWIGATVLVFLVLSSIPILMDRWSKWVTLGANRKLAQQISQMKASVGMSRENEHAAFRLRFSPDHRLTYTIERLNSCANPFSGVVVSSGDLVRGSYMDQYVLLTPQQGQDLSIPGLVESICIDSLTGAEETPKEDSIAAFGVISVKDLADKRTDRVSTLIFKGPSAELSFE